MNTNPLKHKQQLKSKTTIKGNQKVRQQIKKSPFIGNILSKFNRASLLSLKKGLTFQLFKAKTKATFRTGLGLFSPIKKIKGDQLNYQIRRKKMIDELNNANDDLTFLQQKDPDGTSIKDLTKMTKTLNYRAKTSNPTSGDRSSKVNKTSNNTSINLSKKGF